MNFWVRGCSYLTWNLKHLFINGCFNWMVPDLYLGNGCFTKHPFKTGCLGYQAYIGLPGSNRFQRYRELEYEGYLYRCQ